MTKPIGAETPGAKPKRSLVWVLLAGGAAMVLLAVIALVAVAGVAIFLMMGDRGAGQKVEPIAQKKPDPGAAKPKVPPDESPVLIKPPVPGPPDEPIVIDLFNQPTPGFVSLFNGKDLTGWTPTKFSRGTWRVEEGVLVGTAPDNGMNRLLTERPQVKDFHLRLELRMRGKGSGHVSFRSRSDGFGGYNTPINGANADGVRLGILHGSLPGKSYTLPRIAEGLTPHGQWATLEFIAEGKRLIVKVDGKVTTDTEDESTLDAGHLVLSHHPDSTMEFRKIEIKELNFVAAPPPAPMEGFVQLFNGKDLTGWKLDQKIPGTWRVENSLLVGGAAGQSRLLTELPQPKDFHLRMEARMSEKGSSTVLLRCPDGPLMHGYESQITGSTPGGAWVGRLYSRLPTTASQFPAVAQPRIPIGQWFTLEFIAQGSSLIVMVDGKVTTNALNADTLGAGHLALLVVQNTTMEYRRIEIKELNRVVAPPPPVPAEGFVPLFNGKDLTGWKPLAEKPGDWRVVNGTLTGNAQGAGFLLTTRDDYKDYHLRLEARLKDAGGGSGVMFRYALDYLGYEASIADKRTGFMTVRTKSKIGGNSRDLITTGQAGPAPPGEWVPMEILAEGNRVRVKINGVTTTDYVDDKNNFRQGHIGLRDFNQCIEFRRIEIKELNLVAAPPVVAPPAGAGAAPFPGEAGFVSLFNGKDLTGWKSGNAGVGDWRVVNGVLTGAGPKLNALYTPRDDYADFHLRMEARISVDGSSTVAFRYPYDPEHLEKRRSGGYSVRINDRPEGFVRSGGIMVYEQVGARNLVVKEQLMTAGQWFNLEIIAQGNHVITKINGRDGVNFMNPKTLLTTGRIVLGVSEMKKQTVMEFRRIEIKEFKAIAPPPPPPPARPLEGFVPLFNGKDLTDWFVKGKEGWKVSAEGELIGQGPDTSLVTRRVDFRNFIAKIELSASADVDGFFAFRQNLDPQGKVVALTSRLQSDGVFVRAGGVGIDGDKFESMPFQIKFKPAEVFRLEIHVLHDELRITNEGKTIIGSLIYPPGRHPPGAIGLHLTKGTVRIKKFEISAEAPVGKGAGPATPRFNGEGMAFELRANQWNSLGALRREYGIIDRE